MNFGEIWYLSISWKSVEEVRISSESKKNIWYYRWRSILHLWSHLAESFSEWETFRRNVIEKIKTHILCSFILFPKIVLFVRYCVKCGRARQATDGNIVWRTRLACLKSKATDKHSEYEIRIAFLLHQSLHKHSSFLRYTFIVSLVSYTM